MKHVKSIAAIPKTAFLGDSGLPPAQQMASVIFKGKRV